MLTPARQSTEDPSLSCVLGAFGYQVEDTSELTMVLRGFGRQNRFLPVQICKRFEVQKRFVLLWVLLSRSVMCWHVLPEYMVDV